ncbi:MAG: YkgJ family cysteine cluster protein, partial [Pseudomonadota bacterium]
MTIKKNIEKNMTPETKCSFCPNTKCCQYTTQQIDTPRKKSEFQVMLWQISHRFVEFYKDSDGWFLMFISPCEHVDEQGGCGIYEHRPDICRDHSNDYCEYDSPAEEGFELYFRNY